MLAPTLQVFEDEESRAFYQSLVDVRAVVPAVLLGDKGKEGGSQQEGGAAPGSDAASSEAAGGGGEAGGKKELPGSASSASLGGSKQELSYEDILEVGNTCQLKLAAVCAAVATCSWTSLPCWMCVQHPCSLVAQPSACLAVPPQGKGAGGAAAAGEEGREPSQLDLLLGRLPGCVSKELADELAVNFCYGQVGTAGVKGVCNS